MTTVAANPRTNWKAGIEGCILIGIGTMLLRKTVDGQLPLYIHPRYQWLVLACALAVLLIGAARLLQVGANAERLHGNIGMYGLLLAPLLLGVLIPARPAGSALVDLRQSGGGRGYRGTNLLAKADSSQWNLFDWMVARATLEPADVQGKPADVIGFVYRDSSTPSGEFYVVRYVLACCIADRTGASLAVEDPDGTAPPTDSWVRVVGTAAPRQQAGQAEIILEGAQVTQVEQPKEPYLYP